LLKFFKKRHDHVVRDVRNLINDLKGVPNIGDTPMFQEATYIHEQNGQEYPMYLMNRDGFTLLAMGFTGTEALKFKVAYIDAFNKMEQALKDSMDKRRFIRESTKKGYRRFTDSIHTNVIPAARQRGSKIKDEIFYINGAKILNKVLGCKPYSRDNLTVGQLNMLDNLQDVGAIEYEYAASHFRNTTDINNYVFNKLTHVASVLHVQQRLEITN